MATWSSNPSVPHTGGTFDFPTATTEVVYTINYTDDNGCTAQTNYTVKTATTMCTISLLVTSSMCSISFRADGTYPSCSEFDNIEWGITTSSTESSFDDGRFNGSEVINNYREEDLVDITQDGDYYVYWRNENSHDVSGSSKVTLSSCNIPCRDEDTIEMNLLTILQGFADGDIDRFILSPNIVTRDSTTQSYCTMENAKGIAESRLIEKLNNNYHPINTTDDQVSITKSDFISETINHASLPKDYKYKSEIFSGFNPLNNNASPNIYCYVHSQYTGLWHLWNEIAEGFVIPGCPVNCEDYYNLSSGAECSPLALKSIKVGGSIDFYNHFISYSQGGVGCGFNIYLGSSAGLGYEGVCRLDEE